MHFVKRFQISLEALSSPESNAHYVVAYSGGIDSHVLLHCCKKLKLPVRAVHVHHGLQAIADDWVLHCQNVCDVLNIQLDVVHVDGRKKKGQSPEESARAARYTALQNSLMVGDCLLTAQHLNDQAETVLIQLCRTAGAAGLSAMPAVKKIGEHVHLRPLLTFSSREIENFAKQANLYWIEDPSNQDINYDRNYIRKNVMPMLEQRWPEITQQLSTVSALQANNLQVLEDMAAIDLANSLNTFICNRIVSAYEIVSVLSITRLRQLSSARLLNLLRYWLGVTNGLALNSLATRNLLEEIEKTLVNSSQDTKSVVVFNGLEFRKYQNDLYLLKEKISLNQMESNNDRNWLPTAALNLAELNIQIKSVLRVGKGLSKSLLTEPLTIRFRKGGEYFHPVQRQHSQRLKKLLQEANIPPWDRGTLPLVYFKDELIAIVGLTVSKQYAVGAEEEGWIIDVVAL